MSEAKRLFLQKLGEQKLQELLDKIDDLETALTVIKEELVQIKSQMPNLSKTEDSNNEEAKDGDDKA